MIKAVVFDLDHTLYDRYETLRKIQKKIRENRCSKGTARSSAV